MMRTSSERLRKRLVDRLEEKGAIRSDAVRSAFLAVPRERFLPDVVSGRGLEAVYRDEAIITKRDPRGLPLSSSSQPSLMARMLELLALRPGDRVLEIGVGTGYNAALVCELVGRRGRVTSIEIDPVLAGTARKVLRDAGHRVSVVVGDGRQGHAGNGPYDRIIATACADAIPTAWCDQLIDGGRLELPLELDSEGAPIQLIPVLERDGKTLHSTALTWGYFMALHDGGGHQPRQVSTFAASRSLRGRYAQLASFTGAGLDQLSAARARALLADALTPTGPARRSGTTRLSSATPPLLLIYLLLNTPARQRVSGSGAGRLGVGLIDRQTASLALVSVRNAWSRSTYSGDGRARWRLDSYGGNGAADQLDHLITRWQQIQREHHADLQLTARRDTPTLRLSFEWTSAQRPPA